MTEPVSSTTPVQPRSRLFRSRNDRVIAGVCGGVARRLNVDPLLLRVVAVVLVFYGGVGLLLYALGWLLLPEDDGDSLFEQAFSGDRRESGRSTGTRALALLLVLFVVVSAIAVLNSTWYAMVLLSVTGLGLFLLLQRERQAASLTEGPASAVPTSPTAGQPGAPATPAGPPADSTQPTPTTDATTDQVAWDPERPWDQLALASADSPAPPPPGPDPYLTSAPQAEQRPRSALRLLTLSVAFLALGTLWAVDVSGVQVPASAYVATALAVVGLGLVAGSWFGRARGLIGVGIVLTVLLLITSLIGRPWIFRADNVTVQPSSVTQVSGVHDYGTGEIRYDLSAVDFTGSSADLTIHHGVGLVEVRVPPEVDVLTKANVGIGSIRSFDTVSGGMGVSRNGRDFGADGPGGGSLLLNIDLGIGEVVVTREAA